MELSERKREILKEVIDSFIESGEPVGSKAIMERLKKPCSSATIRGEMNDMEKMGLLEQPHTSAGRIPTGRGYRLYVDSLMENYSLSFEETLLLNSLLSDKVREGTKILEDMTELLSRMTGLTVITFAKESLGTIERFEGVFVSHNSFLLVMITSSGKAVTKQIRVDFPLDPDRVSFFIESCNSHLAKKELGGITLERMIAMEKDLGEYRAIIPLVLQIIYETLADFGEIRVQVKGMANLLSYPEFSEEKKSSEIIAELEDRAALMEQFGKELPSHLSVHIGSGKKGLASASRVTCPFRLKSGMQGAVCILGPKRMNYAKAMARLQYLAKEIQAVHGFEPALPLIETKEP